jgi:hypothetical protein
MGCHVQVFVGEGSQCDEACQPSTSSALLQGDDLSQPQHSNSSEQHVIQMLAAPPMAHLMIFLRRSLGGTACVATLQNTSADG